MQSFVVVDPVSYTHLDVYKRQIFVHSEHFGYIIVFKSVSYTHLDVYKRQAQECCKTVLTWISAFNFSSNFHSGKFVRSLLRDKTKWLDKYPNWFSLKLFIASKEFASITVSYTHLDVYKRQSWRRLRKFW